MQNTVYESKQNGEDFILLHSVTDIRFGNCPANGLVTEQPQYSVAVCIFSTWQNTETKLISNGLRFIFTCLLSLAQPITFHCARHTWATMAYHCEIHPGIISEAMGHSSITVTETYLKPFSNRKIDEANQRVISFVKNEGYPV